MVMEFSITKTKTVISLRILHNTVLSTTITFQSDKNYTKINMVSATSYECLVRAVESEKWTT